MVANEGFVPNERLVSTEVYEAFPDGEALDTLTLTEVDGRTRRQRPAARSSTHVCWVDSSRSPASASVVATPRSASSGAAGSGLGT
jgi:hypothetical protein